MKGSTSLQSIRIYILTTTGVSRVVYLGKEDAGSGLRSAVRVDGETEPLHISGAYGNFVDTFVQRFSGHRIYRADISRRIEDGTSWQLGFLLVHRLLEDPARTLAVEDQPHDVSIFVTGELRDRPGTGQIDVQGVIGIADKVRCARDNILAELDAGKEVFVVLPEANKIDIEGISWTGRSVPLDRFSFVGSFDDAEDLVASPETVEPASEDPVSDALTPDEPALEAPAIAVPNPVKKWPIKRLVALFAFAGACGLALVFTNSLGTVGPGAGGGGSAVKLGAVTFELAAVGPKDDLGCSGNRFRDSPEVAKLLPKPDQDVPVFTDGANTCAFDLAATNKSDKEVAVYSFLYQSGIGSADNGRTLVSQRTDLIAPGIVFRLRHRLPRFRLAQEAWGVLAFSVRRKDQTALPSVFEDMAGVQRARKTAVKLGAKIYRREVVFDR